MEQSADKREMVDNLAGFRRIAAALARDRQDAADAAAGHYRKLVVAEVQSEANYHDGMARAFRAIAEQAHERRAVTLMQIRELEKRINGS